MRLRVHLTIMALAALTTLTAPERLPAQGQGKGVGKEADSRGRARQAPRRETRADQRIERRLEREFAGDVALERGPQGMPADGGRGRASFMRKVTSRELHPSLRSWIADDRVAARAAVGAVARAHMRGVGEDVFRIDQRNGDIRVLNHAGDLLVALDSLEARQLGSWEVIPIEDATAGAPAFCRSGAGHPVFGRQWCIDKRFGLGPTSGHRWGRTERLTDVVFRETDASGVLRREALLAVLGPTAFDRLALHAVTLGLSDPITARWMLSEEPGSPRVLVVSAGALPIAEVVDIDRDNRADLLVVALRAW